MNQEKPEIYKFLPIFRGAMLATVLMIGGLLWVMIGSVQENALEGDLRYSMNLVFLVLIAITALVVMFVRRKIEEESALQQKSIYTLLAWASAEGIAFLGAICMIWGDPSFFIAGLTVLLMTMFVVPVPAEA